MIWEERRANEAPEADRLNRMATLAQAFAAIDRLHSPLAARHVRRSGVFGSGARGEGRCGSDIDFLVELTLEGDLFDISGIKSLLTNELGCAVDVVSIGGLKPDIREAVLKEVRYAA